MATMDWRVFNPLGSRRVVVTKELPGEQWLKILDHAQCRVEICTKGARKNNFTFNAPIHPA